MNSDIDKLKLMATECNLCYEFCQLTKNESALIIKRSPVLRCKAKDNLLIEESVSNSQHIVLAGVCAYIALLLWHKI